LATYGVHFGDNFTKKNQISILTHIIIIIITTTTTTIIIPYNYAT